MSNKNTLRIIITVFRAMLSLRATKTDNSSIENYAVI